MKNRIKNITAMQGMSVAELARKIGMKAHTLRRYTRVRIDGTQEAQPSVELAQRIAGELQVHIDDVLGLDLGMEEQDRRPEKIPLYGSAEGGLGLDISDVTEPIDTIDMPPWLASVPDAYAVFITGASMKPRFYPREVVYVHPHRPYDEGDYVIVQLRANCRTHAIVKRFVELTDTHVVLKQYNPNREIRHLREEVLAIHTIVGGYFA